MEDDLRRIMDILGIDEDVEKYIEVYRKVEKLFNELDKYGDPEEEPLYHPLDINCELDDDTPMDSTAGEWLDTDDEGYVEAPPMRRR